MGRCLHCGIDCPGDPDTGYHADGVCGGCTSEGYYVNASGELAHESEDYFFDRLMDDELEFDDSNSGEE